MPRNEIPPSIEAELITLYEKTIESKHGSILYKIPKSRAQYLRRWAIWLRNIRALESTMIYLPTDRLFGLGIYWNMRVVVTDEGLWCQRLTEPELTPTQVILQVAFTDREIVVEPPVDLSIGKLLNRFRRAKLDLEKKGEFPEVTSVFFLQTSPHYLTISKSTHLSARPNEFFHEANPEEIQNMILENKLDTDD